MDNSVTIEQSTGKNSSGENIGIQNVYNGISPQEAAKITTELFVTNFPKLQAQALETVNQRFDELESKLFERLSNNNFVDYSIFAEPDVQYILCKAGEFYARFGKTESLDALCCLIESRIELNTDDYLKMIIDSAIQVIPQLSTDQINYLTVMFLLKRAHFTDMITIERLVDQFNRIEKIYGPVVCKGFSMMNNLGCFDFCIGKVEEICAKRYSLNKEQITKYMPKDFECVSGDYFTSDMGTVIAITNINIKENKNYNIKNFICF